MSRISSITAKRLRFLDKIGNLSLLHEIFTCILLLTLGWPLKTGGFLTVYTAGQNHHIIESLRCSRISIAGT